MTYAPISFAVSKQISRIICACCKSHVVSSSEPIFQIFFSFNFCYCILEFIYKSKQKRMHNLEFSEESVIYSSVFLLAAQMRHLFSEREKATLTHIRQFCFTTTTNEYRRKLVDFIAKKKKTPKTHTPKLTIKMWDALIFFFQIIYFFYYQMGGEKSI